MPNFLGRLQTILFGAAIGRASSDSVSPVLEPVRQHAWEQNRNKVLDPNTAAEALTQGIISEDEAQFDSVRSGVSDNRFGVLWRLAQRVPGISEARTLRRRSKADGTRAITLDQLHHAYAKAQIEPQYWDALDTLVREILSPGEIAAAIHRGLIPDPGLLQGQQPEPPFSVPSYPVYDKIDALDEAFGHGIDRDRLGVLVGLQGLPMGPHEAAQAVFRKIITFGDYIRAFNESNNRNEWAKAIFEQTKQIPTARDFMENALRGHHDFDWAAEQAARHGMEREDAFLIYQNQGRPLNLHQITQGLAWGGTYEPGQGDNADPWMQAVLLGAVRPEYYNLQHHLKYNLPSALYFRTLQQQDVLTEDEAATWYRRLGWPPDLADKVAKAYATHSTATTADQRVKLATSQAIAALKRQFMLEQTSDAGVTNGLTQIGVSAASADQILNLWIFERLWTEKPLTPAAIKKAYQANDFTIDEAVARLVAQQWSAEDSRIYLTT